jgi:predicted amidohydrolase YtcJ
LPVLASFVFSAAVANTIASPQQPTTEASGIVEQGIPAATIVPARAMGLDKESGTIENAKRGDLILVNGNPLDDIHNIRNVEYVITGGTMYHTAELWQSVGFKP